MKRKLERFAEIKTFSNVFQPSYKELLNSDHKLKGKWNSGVFRNDDPITLELGCGKGEYTISLARIFTKKNFIGIDIKGERMWKGAVYANKDNLNNVAFIRTKIEMINSLFSIDEVNGIWLTFPDPQLNRKKLVRKRLTSAGFLNRYKQFLKPEASVHLKTDDDTLYNYTLDVIEKNDLELVRTTDDLYNSEMVDEILAIKTYYEKQFIEEGKSIKYLEFKLEPGKDIVEP